MAFNPYSQVQGPMQFNLTHYTPEVWTPDVDKVGALMEQLQGEYSHGMNLIDQAMPDALAQDEEHARELRLEYQQKANRVRDSYMGQGLTEGRQALFQTSRDIQKDAMPGGKFHALASRKKQYGELQKRYRDLYKDNPALYDYAVKSIKVQPFMLESGAYGGVSEGNLVKAYSGEEYIDMENNMFRDMQADAVEMGAKPSEVNTANGLMAFMKKKGISEQRIVDTYLGRLPSDMKESLIQDEKIKLSNRPNKDGVFYDVGAGKFMQLNEDGSVTDSDYNPYEIYTREEKEDGSVGYKTNKEGMPVINSNSPIGRRIAGMVRGRAFEQTEYDRLFDPVIVARSKAAIERKKMEQQAYMPAFASLQHKDGGIKGTVYFDSNGVMRMRGVEKGNVQERVDARYNSIRDDKGEFASSPIFKGIAFAIANTVNWFDRKFSDNQEIDINDPEMLRIQENLGVDMSQPEGVRKQQFAQLYNQALESAATGTFSLDLDHRDVDQFNDRLAKSPSGLLNLYTITDQNGEVIDGSSLLDEEAFLPAAKGGKPIEFQGRVTSVKSPHDYGSGVITKGEKTYKMQPNPNAMGGQDDANFLANQVMQADYGFNRFRKDFTYRGVPMTSEKMGRVQGLDQYKVTDQSTGQSEFYVWVPGAGGQEGSLVNKNKLNLP